MPKLKQFFIVLLWVLFITPIHTYAQQKPFGDMVVECLAKMKAQPESQQFKNQMNLCENQVNTLIKKEAWYKCIASEIKYMDDKISPASNIADATSGLCKTEFDAIVDSLNVSNREKQDTKDRRIEATKSVALQLTLIIRANNTKSTTANQKQ